jgi:hypothetical protein
VADIGLYDGVPHMQWSTNFQASIHKFAGQFIMADICSVPVKSIRFLNVYQTCEEDQICLFRSDQL